MMLGCFVIRISPTSANAGGAVAASRHAIPNALNHRFIARFPFADARPRSLSFMRAVAAGAPFAIARERLGVWRVGARQGPALLGFLQQGSVKQFLLGGISRDLIGEGPRERHAPFAVSDN